MKREKALKVIMDLEIVKDWIINNNEWLGLCDIIRWTSIDYTTREIILNSVPWYNGIKERYNYGFWWPPRKKEPRLKYIKKLIKKYEKFI